MERRTGIGLLATLIVVLAVLLVLGFAAVPPPSRIRTLGDLQASADFELGGVHFQETYLRDEVQIDGGTTVAFLVHFPDGTLENVTFVYRTFLCSERTIVSAHIGPQVAFHTYCDRSSILVAVY